MTLASIDGLASELTDVLFSNDPFGASMQGLDDYASEVPDLSPGNQRAWRDQVASIVVRCDQPDEPPPAGPDDDRQLLLDVIREKAVRELAAADARLDEFSVSTFPASGPSMMLLLGSRTLTSDPASAAAYLERCRRLPRYLDQCTDRLRAAAAEGLLPVAPLVRDAIKQLRGHLDHPADDPMLAHQAPAGWDGATAWRDDLDRAVADGIRPAIARFTDLLTELLPTARPPERAGLLHLPGGVALYACCVRNGTTLPLDPDEIHRIGRDTLAELEAEMATLGGPALGTHDPAQIMDRLRRDMPADGTGAQAMDRAAAAVARAQERMGDMFHPPLPDACTVEAMPPHMGAFGAPPFYSPAARDGSRPGAYLFNREQPGQAGSWALEATAFHEAVPGHHMQIARLQMLPDMPLLLSAFYVVPHSEGWALYAERLADELGLYSGDLQRLGMLASAAWRAVRLVVDTGLHARGWSRDRAREFALAHSPMPAAFVGAEIDRYISVPGQALGYQIGQREILRLRESSRARLGAAWDIRDFHSAVLDHGNLPLGLLSQVVDDWVTATAATV